MWKGSNSMERPIYRNMSFNAYQVLTFWLCSCKNFLRPLFWKEYFIFYDDNLDGVMAQAKRCLKPQNSFSSSTRRLPEVNVHKDDMALDIANVYGPSEGKERAKPWQLPTKHWFEQEWTLGGDLDIVLKYADKTRALTELVQKDKTYRGSMVGRWNLSDD